MTDNGFEWDIRPTTVDPTLRFQCSICGGNRPGFLTRTVDPRWYIGACLDCGSKRVIFVCHHRTPSQEQETPT